MPQTQSAYTSFAALLNTCGHPVSPAELQGLLLGRCCAGAGFAGEGWLEEAQDLFDSEVPSSLHAALLGLQQMVKTELLAASSVSLTLLLPSDDEFLAERTIAIGQWAQGFLSGFGGNIGNTELSKDVREIIEDMISIAQIQADEEEDEDGEVAYMEINEYLRVAPLFIFSECANYTPPSADDVTDETPAVH
ncbi:MAG: UPF0149 family protein [Pseudomonas sp.]|jgi:uncharacterized protein YgfB (UPF0149 family)|nr:UPF0149 family protein [Pseudomonas sp.]MDD2224028.1 UPF0149 family protein [Pseudomonas sp.]MDY0414041.1 UPF0149 family protein [Pseudomonas sp.]NLO55252.1 UPF0149 family protein [Gammaproteobacteria bacterium]